MERKYFLTSQGCILNEKPCREKMIKITNKGLLPNGGLWISPLYSKDILVSTYWCDAAQHYKIFDYKYKNAKLYQIILKPESKILFINKEDYDNGVYDNYISDEGRVMGTYFLDYAKLAEEYDVISFEYRHSSLSLSDIEFGDLYKYEYSDFVKNLLCECSVITNFDTIDDIKEF